MACRQTEYAHKLKRQLIEKLGGKCALCQVDAVELLQFDHINGRHYDVSKLSFSARLARYARETESGLIRLLCEDCNLKERKTNDNGQHVATAATVERTVDIPF